MNYYNRAIDLNPKQPFILYKRLGDTMRKNGNIKKAIAAYQYALQIQPHNSELRQRVEQLTAKTLSLDDIPNRLTYPRGRSSDN